LSIPTPVVLRIMPKVGSSAHIGYIYDPDPSLDGGEVLEETLGPIPMLASSVDSR
jgi:hypothetical protein